MNLNTIFLLLLVIAAYLNLYLTFNRRNQRQKTRLPISSKEWREKVNDENFRSWLTNRERLRNRKDGNFNK